MTKETQNVDFESALKALQEGKPLHRQDGILLVGCGNNSPIFQLFRTIFSLSRVKGFVLHHQLCGHRRNHCMLHSVWQPA